MSVAGPSAISGEVCIFPAVEACGVLDLASAARCPDRALLSKHSNQNKEPNLRQESDAHEGDRKEHVARRSRVHECLVPAEIHEPVMQLASEDCRDRDKVN